MHKPSAPFRRSAISGDAFSAQVAEACRNRLGDAPETPCNGFPGFATFAILVGPRFKAWRLKGRIIRHRVIGGALSAAKNETS